MKGKERLYYIKLKGIESIKEKEMFLKEELIILNSLKKSPNNINKLLLEIRNRTVKTGEKNTYTWEFVKNKIDNLIKMELIGERI